MSDIDRLIARVRDAATQRGLRPATLARMSGLALNTLRDMHSQDWNPRIETLRKVEAALEEEAAA
ncbi:hypothetical protein HBA54_27290 [Pelagibius litoralis]|uniref:Uncharacterized protein n=1 Tax=Pelagibius litoralis TaxID=374515 RepID=A0A967KGM2_9PROT|nr:hypothetical protein [Pelagibius litoralis]NIA72300.1 hypothetical protein [Pelagibius litoralis]